MASSADGRQVLHAVVVAVDDVIDIVGRHSAGLAGVVVPVEDGLA
jgi:hypothetical protein